MITTAMEHFATLERASDLPLSLGTPRATSINTGHRGDLTTGHEPWRTENLRYNGRVSVTLRTISWVRGTSYSPKHMPKSALERGESSRCRSPDVAPDVGPDAVPMSHPKYTVSGESSRRPGATSGATSGARQASAAIAWARHTSAPRPVTAYLRTCWAAHALNLWRRAAHLCARSGLLLAHMEAALMPLLR